MMRFVTTHSSVRFGLFVTFLLCCSTSWAEIVSVPLTDTDCIKCHRQPAQQIRDLGGAHKTELGCLGCHEQHPPSGDAVIPACGQCHDGDDNPHYQLTGCQGCHDPHAPQVAEFGQLKNAKPACLSCHDAIGSAMARTPSLHSEQDCTACHQQHGTRDGQFKNCLACHDKHSPQMTYRDCLGCHDPHQPTAYQWNSKTPTQQCSACHADQVTQLTTEGAAHAGKVHCSDCHSQHPPADQGVIPACADCHAPDDHSHYALENCSGCHKPHAPLNIELEGISPIKPVCVSCHAAPQREMTQYPSAHADMDCNECHQQHGDHQACMECHSGHSDNMSYNDCLRCHQHHSPTRLQFSAAGIEPQLCGSCHRGQLGQLAENTTRHAELQCVFCHKRTHKVTLSCDNCHGEPHDSSIHQHFNDCGQCHQGPHNLRN